MIPLDGAPLRSALPMTEGWALLERALTNEKTGKLEGVAEVAQLIGVSEDLLYRWMRRPLTSDSPSETGRRNPVDYFLRLLWAVYIESPNGARLIVNHVVSEFARLEAKHGHAAPLNLAQVEDDLREIEYRARRTADAFARERR